MDERACEAVPASMVGIPLAGILGRVRGEFPMPKRCSLFHVWEKIDGHGAEFAGIDGFGDGA